MVKASAMKRKRKTLSVHRKAAMKHTRAMKVTKPSMSAGFAAVGIGRGDLEAAGLDPEILDDHRQRIHKHQENGAFPGFGECITASGKVAYLDLCGFSNKEQTIKLSERTLFRGYSMMKPMTATAFMTLVEQGRVRLDDPVSRYLPKFGSIKVQRKSGKGVEPLKKAITLRHLLMHTSGIGYGPGSVDRSVPAAARTDKEKLYKDIHASQQTGDMDTLEKLCDALSEKPLLFQPGADYEYGFGMDVIGRVIELVTGQPLKTVIQDRVLTPIGMRDTTWDVPRAAARQICGYYRIMRATGVSGRYLERLDGAVPEDSAYVRGSAAHYGGPNGVPTGGGAWGHNFTGLLFSMRDVALFCQMLLNGGVSVSGNRVLQASTVRLLGRDWLQMKKASDKPSPPGWGSPDVGWNPLGNVQLTGPHAGAMFMGGMSYYWIEPRRKIAAVMMTETYWQVTPLGWKDDRDTMEKVLERAFKAAKKRKAASGTKKDVCQGSAPKSRRKS